MTCADCLEPVLESERVAVRYCCLCKKPMHSECSMLLGGDDACEACYASEGTRFTLVMAAGTGEGRDPVLEEGDKAYAKKLPGEALRLVDARLEGAEVLPWDATVAELAAAKDVEWFGEEEDDE